MRVATAMVEDRITDGKRIAQFLASELTGLERGTLGRVDVVDADPGAEPTSAGSRAYRIARNDDPFASVVLFPEHVELRLDEGSWTVPEGNSDISAEGRTIGIVSVAAVKPAVDCLDATLGTTDKE